MSVRSWDSSWKSCQRSWRQSQPLMEETVRLLKSKFLENGLQFQGCGRIFRQKGWPGNHWIRSKISVRFSFGYSVFDGAQEENIHHMAEMAEMPKSVRFAVKIMTGERFSQKVTVGYAHILKLHHLVDEKIHSRSIGPYSRVTQQPLGEKLSSVGNVSGKWKSGLWKRTVAFTLQELLTVKSDDTFGRNRIYESIVKGNINWKRGIFKSLSVNWKPLPEHRIASGIRKLTESFSEEETKPEPEDSKAEEAEAKAVVAEEESWTWKGFTWISIFWKRIETVLPQCLNQEKGKDRNLFELVKIQKIAGAVRIKLATVKMSFHGLMERFVSSKPSITGHLNLKEWFVLENFWSGSRLRMYLRQIQTDETPWIMWKCGVEVIESSTSGTNGKHQACFSGFPCLFLGVPSCIATILEMTIRDLERVLFWCLHRSGPGEFGTWKKQFGRGRGLSEMLDKFPDPVLGMGAKVKELLLEIDLPSLNEHLRKEMREVVPN